MDLIQVETTSTIDQDVIIEDFYDSIFNEKLIDKLKGTIENLDDCVTTFQEVLDRINERRNRCRSNHNTPCTGLRSIDIHLYRALDFIMNKILSRGLKTGPNNNLKRILIEIFLSTKRDYSPIEDITKVKFLFDCIIPSRSDVIRNFTLDLLDTLIETYGIHYVLDKICNDKCLLERELNYLWETFVRIIVTIPISTLNNQVSPSKVVLYRVESYIFKLVKQIVHAIEAIANSQKDSNEYNKKMTTFRFSETLAEILSSLSSSGHSDLIVSTLVPLMFHEMKSDNMLLIWNNIIDRVIPRQKSRLIRSLLIYLRTYENKEMSGQDLEINSLNLSNRWIEVFGYQYIARKEILKCFLGRLSFSSDEFIRSEFMNTLIINTIMNLDDLRLVLLCAIENYGSEVIQVILRTWSNQGFLKYSTFRAVEYITHAFVLSLLIAHEEMYSIKTSIYRSVISGVQVYLEHPNGDIRVLGMTAAELFVKYSKSKYKLDFELEVDDRVRFIRGLMLPLTKTSFASLPSIDNSNTDKPYSHNVLSNKDSKGELLTSNKNQSSLLSYDDNISQSQIYPHYVQQSHKHIPWSLQECYEQLRSDNVDIQDTALSFMDNIIQKAQGEILTLSVPICNALLKLNNSHLIKDYNITVVKLISTIATRDPEQVISYLLEQMSNSECGLNKKLIILDSISTFTSSTRFKHKDIFKKYKEFQTVINSRKFNIDANNTQNMEFTLSRCFYSLIDIADQTRSTSIARGHPKDVILLTRLIIILSELIVALSLYTQIKYVAQEFIKYVVSFKNLENNAYNEPIIKTVLTSICVMLSCLPESTQNDILRKPDYIGRMTESIKKWIEELIVRSHEESDDIVYLSLEVLEKMHIPASQRPNYIR